MFMMRFDYLQLEKASACRREGKAFVENKDLTAANHCYNNALEYLVPGFESLEKDLLEKGYDMLLSNKMSHLVNEIAIIVGNQSLVMLKEGDYHKAILNAQQSVTYFPTEKVIAHTAILNTL